MIALLLLGCTGGDKPIYDSGGDETGIPQCGRVRGTSGVLLYQNGGDTIASPIDPPDAVSRTSGVAGPIGDELTYMAVTNGRVIVSHDAGCNWDLAGNLPASGDWALLAAGSRVYAFDRAGSDGARTDDLGANWTTFTYTEPFIGLPAVDAADPNRLRGLQSRGVVTSSDGGDSWPVSGSAPSDLPTPESADFLASDLDQAAAAGTGGVWRTENGGQSWELAFASTEARTVALHPDGGGILFADAFDEDGVGTVWRWDGTDQVRLADETQIDMTAALPLWPVPGDPSTALSGAGPVPNSTGEDSLALYVIGTSGTHTVRIATYYGMNAMAFGSDRWVAAVDAIP